MLLPSALWCASTLSPFQTGTVPSILSITRSHGKGQTAALRHMWERQCGTGWASTSCRITPTASRLRLQTHCSGQCVDGFAVGPICGARLSRCLFQSGAAEMLSILVFWNACACHTSTATKQPVCQWLNCVWMAFWFVCTAEQGVKPVTFIYLSWTGI